MGITDKRGVERDGGRGGERAAYLSCRSKTSNSWCSSSCNSRSGGGSSSSSSSSCSCT